MQHAMGIDEMSEIISQIKYKSDWKFRLITKGDGFLFQITFMEKDLTSESEDLEMQFCRKWYISPYSTVSEVISTAYKAVQAAELHEIGERFKYRGKMIFNPHMNYDELVHNIDAIGIDVREPLVKEPVTTIKVTNIK